MKTEVQAATYQSYDQWFWELSALAESEEFELGHKDSYLEYYDDGDTPAQALAEEIVRAEESEEQ